MAVDIYSKTAWNNGTAPSLSKTQLDHIETGIKNNNTAIISLQSVQAECENYASEAEASKIASANSATSASNSALSALASANTAKAEADRAVAVAGVDIATETVAGLMKSSSEIAVDIGGTPTLKQTDSSGLVGTSGLKVTLQSLIDFISGAVKWKSLGTVSNVSKDISLPSTFCCVHVLDQSYALSIYIPRILLSSTARYFRVGYYTSSSDNGDFLITASLTTLSYVKMTYNGSEVSDSAKISYK